jgi:hypothetical protein
MGRAGSHYGQHRSGIKAAVVTRLLSVQRKHVPEQGAFFMRGTASTPVRPSVIDCGLIDFSIVVLKNFHNQKSSDSD